MIKEYKVTHDSGLDLIFEVSDIFDLNMHASFWSGMGANTEIEEYLSFVSKLIFEEMVKRSYGMSGILRIFNDGSDMEGMPYLNGRTGLKLLHTDDFKISKYDFEVELIGETE